MINFDALPSGLPSNDFPIIPEGKHIAKIVKAEMKEKKDGTGEYLSITWEVYDDTDGNTKIGNIFDIMSESDSQYMQYKIKRFIQALDINIGNKFELRDLCKVCNNKKAIISVSIGKDRNDQDRSQINIFDKNMYDTYNEQFKDVKPSDSVPFDEASAKNY